MSKLRNSKKQLLFTYVGSFTALLDSRLPYSLFAFPHTSDGTLDVVFNIQSIITV